MKHKILLPALIAFSFAAFCATSALALQGNGGVPSSGPGSGTITGVTAGTGLSGGGTTGSVTVNLSTPVTPANGGVGAMTGAPMWMRNFGTGVLGSNNCITNIPGGGEFDYTDFTVPLGQSCIVTNGSIIRATGTCTIAGTLFSAGQNGAELYGEYGGSGGSGGSGAGNSSAARGAGPGQSNTNFTTYLAPGGTASSASAGVAGGTFSLPMQTWLTMQGPGTNIRMAGGGGASAGGSTGGALGAGGQPIFLICKTINFTGTIDARGHDGGAAAANSTGGGGAGGGAEVTLAALTYTANSGNIYVGGGSPGNCYNPAIVLDTADPGVLATGLTGNLGNGAIAHVSTFAAGNPTVITVDAGGANYVNPPACTVVGTGGGANTGSGATCSCTLSGGAVNACTVTGGNGGYGTGTTYIICFAGAYGGNGWAAVFTIQ